MKLHELEINHDELSDITIGKKTFIIRSDVLNFQEGDLIRFVDDTPFLLGVKVIDEDAVDVFIDENALYRIIYVSECDSGIKDGYCVLGIKKLEVR